MLYRYHISGLLLAAFLSWLVHSVVPHHHHGQEICFKSIHCHDEVCADSVSPGGTCHTHDHGGDHDGCFLKQLTFLPGYTSKVVARSVQLKQGKFDMKLVFPDLENPGPSPCPFPISQTKNRKHFSGSPPPVTCHFIYPCGLRAPPSV